MIVSGQATHDSLVEELQRLIPQIRCGLSLDENQPFMGPLIDAAAAEQLLAAQQQLIAQGANAAMAMRADDSCPALVSPGLIALTDEQQAEDCENFGPLLTVQVADSLEQATHMAAATEYGLSAGFIGDREQDFLYFLEHVNAGVVNWNRQTTGASGRLPFGGIGLSGNHHPSGYFAADYCSYPVASLESEALSEASKPVPGLSFSD